MSACLFIGKAIPQELPARHQDSDLEVASILFSLARKVSSKDGMKIANKHASSTTSKHHHFNRRKQSQATTSKNKFLQESTMADDKALTSPSDQQSLSQRKVCRSTKSRESHRNQHMSRQRRPESSALQSPSQEKTRWSGVAQTKKRPKRSPSTLSSNVKEVGLDRIQKMPRIRLSSAPCEIKEEQYISGSMSDENVFLDANSEEAEGKRKYDSMSTRGMFFRSQRIQRSQSMGHIPSKDTSSRNSLSAFEPDQSNGFLPFGTPLCLQMDYSLQALSDGNGGSFSRTHTSSSQQRARAAQLLVDFNSYMWDFFEQYELTRCTTLSLLDRCEVLSVLLPSNSLSHCPTETNCSQSNLLQNLETKDDYFSDDSIFDDCYSPPDTPCIPDIANGANKEPLSQHAQSCPKADENHVLGLHTDQNQTREENSPSQEGHSDRSSDAYTDHQKQEFPEIKNPIFIKEDIGDDLKKESLGRMDPMEVSIDSEMADQELIARKSQYDQENHLYAMSRSQFRHFLQQYHGDAQEELKKMRRRAGHRMAKRRQRARQRRKESNSETQQQAAIIQGHIRAALRHIESVFLGVLGS